MAYHNNTITILVSCCGDGLAGGEEESATGTVPAPHQLKRSPPPGDASLTPNTDRKQFGVMLWGLRQDDHRTQPSPQRTHTLVYTGSTLPAYFGHTKRRCCRPRASHYHPPQFLLRAMILSIMNTASSSIPNKAKRSWRRRRQRPNLVRGGGRASWVASATIA